MKKLTTVFLVSISIVSCSSNNIILLSGKNKHPDTVYDKRFKEKSHYNDNYSISDSVLLKILGREPNEKILLGYAAGSIIGSAQYNLVNSRFNNAPTGVYKKVSPLDIYLYSVEFLNKQKFDITRQSKEKGLIKAEKNIGTVKKILLWKWKQKQVVFLDIKNNIDTKNSGRFDISYFLLEKTPLADKYNPIKLDDNSNNNNRLITNSILKFIEKKGG